MADPETNIEDLEDGEIESDGDDNVEVEKDTKNAESENVTVGNQPEEKPEIQDFYYSKSGKKKKLKLNKNDQKKDKSKKNRKHSNEDDFASNIERAIRKAMNKNDDIEMQDNDVDERRKHKKRKKHDGNDKVNKKRKKQDLSEEMDENEMMCVRGASPVQKNTNDMFPEDEKDSYESDSSHSDSREPQMQRKKRQKFQQRHKNKNDRRRGNHPMQDPDGVCVYYMQGKCHKGDDCTLSHDAEPPRKMELCKFYLMDCCAKRDKCLYMHADFPCKYYHTGLPCLYKDECKFAHGKPLNDGLKNILLKHIESAPKEILGDFPRLNRDGALKMIQTTQLKLMQQFSDNSDSYGKNIPSLFDLNIPNPLNNSDAMQGNQFNHEKNNRSSSKVRQSRWQNDNTNQNNHVSSSPTNVGSANVLNIKNLTGVLSPRQISDLTKMGIENLDQLGQLTVLQLNSIGISLRQITEIQLNTMSIQKLGLINNVDQQPQFIGSAPVTKDLDLRVPPTVPVVNSLLVSTQLPGQDVDMRFQQSLTRGEESSSNQIQKDTGPNKDMIDIDQYTKDALKFATKDKENINMSNETFENDKVISNEIKDVDHRVLPFSEDDSRIIKSTIVEAPLSTEGDTDIRFLQPEPLFKNPGKRQRLSTTDDEDNNLLIDEKWYSSDEEKGNKKSSPILSPHKAKDNVSSVVEQPKPSVIEPSAVLNKLGDLSKIDISEEVTKLLNTMKNNLHENTPSIINENQQSISRDPRSRKSPSKINEPSKSAPKKPRISIYECIDGEPTDGRRRTDVDLRQTDYNLANFGDTDFRQGSSGDIDFRLGLPFKPLPNYTPASEINGSINSHPPIPYKLVTIHIPRPDYTDIRNSTAKSQALSDPRLRKVFRLSIEESNSDSEKSLQAPNAAPRVDPRRKPKDSVDIISQDQKSNSLDLQTILQNSNWYKDLSSTQKIFVNQHLAPVTQTIKQYQQEKILGKKFDLSAIQSNTILCSIFSNLNVSLNESGEFTALPKPKEALLKTPVGFNPLPFGMNSNMPGPPGQMEPNMNLMNVPLGMGGAGNLNNMNIGMPGFNHQLQDPRGDPRSDPRSGPTPGLLGISPNMPHNFGNNNFGGPNFGSVGFNPDYNYMDGDPNFQRFPNRGGHRGRVNDRWNRGGSGRGHRDRKNFNDRGNWKNDRH